MFGSVLSCYILLTGSCLWDYWMGKEDKGIVLSPIEYNHVVVNDGNNFLFRLVGFQYDMYAPVSCSI